MKRLLTAAAVVLGLCLSASTIALEVEPVTNFDDAMVFVYQNEGYDSDHAADAGGRTRLGISVRFLKLANEDINGDGHFDERDIEALTPGDAYALYREYFWEHYRLDELASDRVATKALDLFVNMRGKRAAECFQRAYNVMHADMVLTEDGILGSQSIATLNAIRPDGIERYVTHVKLEQAEVYRSIVRKDPSQDVFQVGWLRRAALG